MKNEIKKINSRFEVSSNNLEIISEYERPFYIKRQLFRDALRVMMEEIDTLPIEIQNTTDQMTESEIYKLSFFIIGREKLKEIERLAAIGEETENELRKLERRLINGEGDKEPVGLFGTISFDKGRPHGVSIGKLESVETIEGLHGGLIKHLKFRQNGNDCTKCKHSFIDVHYGPSCKRFDAYLKCDYEKREVE